MLRRFRAKIRREVSQARNVARIFGDQYDLDDAARIYIDSGEIHIGKNSRIGAFTILYTGSDPNASPSNPKLIIGEEVYIGEGCNIRAAAADIVIGKGCLIAAGALMVSTNHGIAASAYVKDQPWPLNKKGITVGDDVWIGAQVVILPGAVLGKGVIVAANAVVRGEIPAKAIIAGTPAKIIGFRE